MRDFRKELEALLNSHSRENASNTPDFVLASYLQKSLDALDSTITEREAWYGRTALKVAARFVRADQAPGARKDTRDLVFPINSQKGISKSVIKNNAKTESDREDQVKPDRKDIRPSDVFNANANNVMMINYVVNGYRDMEKAIRTQIPKDKGFDTVKNLSQYLIETGGGGGTKPVGK